jgi:hypothetical protein
VDTSVSRVRVTVVAEEARDATDRARPARVPATTRPSSRRDGTMTSRARPEVDASWFLDADVPARFDPRPIPATGPVPSVAIADIASPPSVSPRSLWSPPRAPCACDATRKLSKASSLESFFILTPIRDPERERRRLASKWNKT